MTSNHTPENFVLIGTLGKTFQLEGGLRFYALGDTEAAAIVELDEVFVSERGLSRIARVREVGQHTILYLAGVTQLEAAKALVNREVYAPLDALPEPEAGAFYLEQLIGLAVYLEDEPLGKVKELVEAGTQDLLLVDTASGEIFIPLQADYVSLEVDKISLRDVPEGLLEL